jgi:hypothetical protein
MSSSGKFASITADLLARKGEARPWGAPAPMAEDLPPKPPLVWRPAAAAPPPPPSEGKDRSCALRMSAHDFERLGILAVKQGTTRQQLLKQALADFLAARAAQYGCACLGACNSNCSHGG